MKTINILGKEFTITKFRNDADTFTMSNLEYRLFYTNFYFIKLKIYKPNDRWFIWLGEKWHPVDSSCKSKTVKTLVLDYILTNFNQIINEEF